MAAEDKPSGSEHGGRDENNDISRGSVAVSQTRFAERLDRGENGHLEKNALALLGRQKRFFRSSAERKLHSSSAMIQQTHKLFVRSSTQNGFAHPRTNGDSAKASSSTIEPRRSAQSSSLRSQAPEVFDELARHYGGLLDKAVDQRIYIELQGSFSQELRKLSARLRRLHACARDVIELHARVLDEKLASAPPRLRGAYVEEGRLVVLELMGRLLSDYRTAFLQAMQPSDKGR